MKILCVCRKGNIRSVEMKKGLNELGYNDVLSVGGLIVSQETMDMLSEWANVILLAKPVHGKFIKKECRHKIDTRFTLGDDLETSVRIKLNELKI